jgi:hypothetical protein
MEWGVLKIPESSKNAVSMKKFWLKRAKRAFPA